LSSSRRGRHDGLDVITLAAGALEATFAPGAGMVCCSLRHDGEELLGQRAGLREYAAAGRTMGIPLLHPWANRLGGWEYEALGRHADLGRLEGSVVKADGETGLPIHGALPVPWTIVELEGARLTAEQHPTWEPGFRAAFPYDHRLRLQASVDGGALRVETTLTALDARVPVAFGFHPYFAPPGAARAGWELELPAMRRMELDERKLPTGASGEPEDLSGPLGERALDDAFEGLGDGAVLAVAGGGRRIAVTFERGYAFTQVFAPLELDAVCFEPMTAPGDALRSGRYAVATPAEPYTAAFSVAVTPA
jgi:galactose mutarotase-like enzyme